MRITQVPGDKGVLSRSWLKEKKIIWSRLVCYLDNVSTREHRTKLPPSIASTELHQCEVRRDNSGLNQEAQGGWSVFPLPQETPPPTQEQYSLVLRDPVFSSHSSVPQSEWSCICL